MSFIHSFARPRSSSLRGRILLLFAGLAIALLGLASLVTQQANAGARAWAEAELLATTRALAQTLDGRFDVGEALLHGLAASSALKSGDLAGFATELSVAAEAAQLGIISLAAPDGSQLLNSLLGPGARVPPGTPANAAARRAMTSGRTEISELYRGPLSGVPQVAISIPVHCAGTAKPGQEARLPPCLALSIALPAANLAAALAAQHLQPGWIAAVMDPGGQIVARSEDHAAWVGTPAVAAVQAVIDANPEAAVVTTRRGDGVLSTVGVARAPASGFRIALAAPAGQFTAPLRAPLIWALVAGVAITAAGLLLALLLARRIDRGVRWLGTLGSQQSGPSLAGIGLSEIDTAAGSLRRAVAMRDAAQAAMLEREANFRGAFEAPVRGMAQADAETGTLLLVNQRFGEITGRTEAALVGGISLFTLVDPEAADANRAALRRGGGYSIEGSCPRPDGTEAWVQLSVALIRDPAVQPPRVVAVLEDISAQRSTEQRQSLLTRELGHRARNALTVVQAAVRLTPRHDPAAFAEAVEARVAALARAHSLLATEGWTGADLRALVEGELSPFLTAAAQGRISLSGPPVPLMPEAVQPLAMAIHELSTNSTKHGALSCPGGRVGVQWSMDALTATLQFRWSEADGPAVVPPTRRGFGSRLLEATVQGQLGGTVERHWLRTGLVCTLDIPLARLIAEPTAERVAGLG